MSMAVAARVGESGCKGGLRVRKDLGKLARLAAEAGSSPVLRWRSPERWHEVEGEADGRDPPVSVCVRGGAARGPRGGALPSWFGPNAWAELLGRSDTVLFCFSFSFMQFF